MKAVLLIVLTTLASACNSNWECGKRSRLVCEGHSQQKDGRADQLNTPDDIKKVPGKYINIDVSDKNPYGPGVITKTMTWEVDLNLNQMTVTYVCESESDSTEVVSKNIRIEVKLNDFILLDSLEIQTPWSKPINGLTTTCSLSMPAQEYRYDVDDKELVVFSPNGGYGILNRAL